MNILERQPPPGPRSPKVINFFKTRLMPRFLFPAVEIETAHPPTFCPWLGHGKQGLERICFFDVTWQKIFFNFTAGLSYRQAR
jgi:hypothetical protein